MKISDERIAEIEAAEKAAEPSEWCEEMVLQGYLGIVDGANIDIRINPGGKGNGWNNIMGWNNNVRRANAAFIAMARAAIPELLSEREEREKESRKRMLALESLTCGGSEYVGDVERCLEYIHRGRESRQRGLGKVVGKYKTRAESAEKAPEALREWALTARRLWGGGGGVHWKSFYAILDAGKPKP